MISRDFGVAGGALPASGGFKLDSRRNVRGMLFIPIVLTRRSSPSVGCRHRPGMDGLQPRSRKIFLFFGNNPRVRFITLPVTNPEDSSEAPDAQEAVQLLFVRHEKTRSERSSGLCSLLYPMPTM